MTTLDEIREDGLRISLEPPVQLKPRVVEDRKVWADQMLDKGELKFSYKPFVSNPNYQVNVNFNHSLVHGVCPTCGGRVREYQGDQNSLIYYHCERNGFHAFARSKNAPLD